MSVAILAVLGACVLWGASFPLAKLILTDLPADHLVLMRFVLAAPLMGAVVAATGARPRRGDLPLLIATGVLCVPVTFLLQFAGLERTTVTSASLLVATATPLLALAGRIVDSERLGFRGWWAVLLSTAGAGVMVGVPGPGRSWTGDGLVLLSMVITVVWVLASKRLTRTYGALVATAWVLLAGTAVLVPTVLLTEGPPSLALPSHVWMALGGLSLGSTVGAFVLWNVGVARMESGRAGVFLNLEPLVGAALGIAFFGDVVGPWLAAGGGLVLMGAGLASLRG